MLACGPATWIPVPVPPVTLPLSEMVAVRLLLLAVTWIPSCAPETVPEAEMETFAPLEWVTLTWMPWPPLPRTLPVAVALTSLVLVSMWTPWPSRPVTEPAIR